MMLKRWGRVAYGLFYVAAGANHLIRPSLYETIMPDYLPQQRLLVLLSGVAEMVGGVLLMIPGVQWVARWLMTALLLAIFPANLHMALHPDRYAAIPTWVLWARLPLQGVLIWLVWLVTGERRPATGNQ